MIKRKIHFLFTSFLFFTSRNPVCRIFGRSHMFVVPKYFNKIAGIGKTAAVGDFCNGFICVGELFTGHLDSIVVQIIHGCAVSKFFEVTTEITGVQVRAPGEGSEIQIFAVVFFDHGKDRLQAGKTPGFPGNGIFLVIVPGKQRSKQQIGTAIKREGIAVGFTSKKLQHLMDNGIDLCGRSREKILDKDFGIQKIRKSLFILPDRRGKNRFQVDQDTFVNAVHFRRGSTAMGKAALNQRCVTFFQIQLTVIQLQMKLPLENMYDLKEGMPVIRHGVSWMEGCYAVKIIGEIQRAMLLLLRVVQIFHNGFPRFLKKC